MRKQSAFASIGITLAIGIVLGDAAIRTADNLQPSLTTIGSIKEVVEISTGLIISALVDTGAALSSLHCTPELLEIEAEEEDPKQNIGKSAVLTLVSDSGEQAEIPVRIEDVSRIRSADHVEMRYHVSLQIRCNGVESLVIVTLNDRSTMPCAMLLGREFLIGKYTVDVSQNNPEPY